jgi:hypothetical protein
MSSDIKYGLGPQILSLLDSNQRDSEHGALDSMQAIQFMTEYIDRIAMIISTRFSNKH